ncbi:MAG: hypothetical protein NTW46_02540 [Candidatus Nealsonbacteria bacterium]|nr:hypothetical protein [Candidatus Nealsonbacteria bacterium]
MDDKIKKKLAPLLQPTFKDLISWFLQFLAFLGLAIVGYLGLFYFQWSSRLEMLSVALVMGTLAATILFILLMVALFRFCIKK